MRLVPMKMSCLLNVRSVEIRSKSRQLQSANTIFVRGKFVRDKYMRDKFVPQLCCCGGILTAASRHETKELFTCEAKARPLRYIILLISSGSLQWLQNAASCIYIYMASPRGRGDVKRLIQADFQHYYCALICDLFTRLCTWASCGISSQVTLQKIQDLESRSWRIQEEITSDNDSTH